MYKAQRCSVTGIYVQACFRSKNQINNQSSQSNTINQFHSINMLHSKFQDVICNLTKKKCMKTMKMHQLRIKQCDVFLFSHNCGWIFHKQKDITLKMTQEGKDKLFTLNSCRTTVILRHLELVPHPLELQFHLLFG